MTYVIPSEFNSFEAALKKFRKKCDRDGTLKAVVERSRGFKKKGQKKREARRRSIHNLKIRKKQEKRNTTIPIYAS